MSLLRQRARPAQSSIVTAMLGRTARPRARRDRARRARPRRKGMVDSARPGHFPRRVYT